MNNTNETKQGRLIVPPTDARLRDRLSLKLNEYRERLSGAGKSWEYQHPELTHKLSQDYRDTCYKIHILEAVLKSESPIDAWHLSRQLRDQWKEAFNLDDYCIACGVIDNYCGNLPGEQVVGGTGLPELPDLKKDNGAGSE